jgi:anti-sigma regulatory factor (Ser/Thr protein kinase)
MNAPISQPPGSNTPTIETLLLRNQLDSLEQLSVWTNTLAEQYHFSPRGEFRLNLALTEAVTNIIQYAYDDKRSHEIKVEVQVQGHTIRIDLTDDGRPFDPLKKPMVSFPRSIDEAAEGGLGIHLIRSYMDECHYHRLHNKNIFTMIFRDTD